MPDIRQLIIKIPAAAGVEVDHALLIPIFHKWIQERRIDQLLLDVVDYRHVHEGPGVMLVAHQGHYSLDGGGGVLGLRYAAKHDEPGPPVAKITEALRRALFAAATLEGEPSLAPGLRFDTSTIEIEVSDRRCEITGAELGDAARGALGSILGDLEIEVGADPRRAPHLTLRASAPIPVADALSALG